MTVLINDFHQPLELWLNNHWPDADHVTLGKSESRPEGSGFSATTIILPVSIVTQGIVRNEKIVLRVEPPEAAVYPTQATGLDIEIAIQYRIMAALNQHTNVNVAPLLGYEDDNRILGAPFFVMRFIEGDVPIENPNYTIEGFFAEASPDQRSQLVNNGLLQMAKLHAVDWQAAGLDWLIEENDQKNNIGTQRQINLWRNYSEESLAGREFPALNTAFNWLQANIPAQATVGFCWGDARPGNIIWQDFKAACVCDFENAFIGPLEIDLGWWLMFDRFSHDAQGFNRLEGEPSLNEQVKQYFKHAEAQGVHFNSTKRESLYYYELFAAVRYTAIVVRVMNRLVKRGDLPEDQTIWKDNPVADLLTTMLNERDIQ